MLLNVTKFEFDYKKVWEDAKNIFSSEISALTYDVWIKQLVPLGVRGDALILKSDSEGARSVIQKNYKDVITKAIQDCTSFITSFEVVVEDAIDEEKLFFDDPKKKPAEEKKQSINSNSSSFNPKFTFENYVVGAGTLKDEELEDENYVEIISVSGFEIDELTGDFASEIRLAYLYQKNKEKVIITGGSFSGNVYDSISTVRFANETFQNNNYVGPTKVLLDNVLFTGGE